MAGWVAVCPAAAVRSAMIVYAVKAGVAVLAVSGFVLGQGVGWGNGLPCQGPPGAYVEGVF
jgi:hypothetical protein